MFDANSILRNIVADIPEDCSSRLDGSKTLCFSIVLKQRVFCCFWMFIQR